MISTDAMRSRGNEKRSRPPPSLPQPAHPRRKHQLYSFSDMSTDESSSEENTTSPRFGQNSNHDDCRQAESKSEEIMWEHGRLLDYKIVNGKPYVLVPWLPTWEPPDEYSKEEVARVKQRFESRTKPKRRSRPPLKMKGSLSTQHI
jgi:hypothetical protein